MIQAPPTHPPLLERITHRLARVGESLRTGSLTGAAWSDDEFNALALEVFAFQFEGCAAYGRFCLGRGRTPDSVDHWSRIPAVPATAFKHLELYSGPDRPEAEFRTSGTTSDRGLRGHHPVASLALYRASCLPWFGRHLVPEDDPLPILALVPSPVDAPESSLSRMMGFVMDRWGASGSRFFGQQGGAVDLPAFQEALARVSATGQPVLVMGTAFAWVHWLDWMAESAGPVVLPPGSRLMETGGFKGRSRTVEREELYAALSAGLSIDPRRMVNEYGMTELLSQLYEPVLRSPDEFRRHVPPPWLRVRALDPDTLAPQPHGTPGILHFLDLANAGSVSSILTEDVGVVDEDGGVRLHGRASGSEPRGCSLAMEELLSEGAL